MQALERPWFDIMRYNGIPPAWSMALDPRDAKLETIERSLKLKDLKVLQLYAGGVHIHTEG